MCVNITDLLQRLNGIDEHLGTLLAHADTHAEAHQTLQAILIKILNRLPLVPKVTNATEHPRLVLDRLAYLDDQLNILLIAAAKHTSTIHDLSTKIDTIDLALSDQATPTKETD